MCSVVLVGVNFMEAFYGAECEEEIKEILLIPVASWTRVSSSIIYVSLEA